ncbi:MAG: hypothetical protein A2086_06025 [Spirochaetes bacterium GWD1_27_9]|nr:MAG: hypothetical protein A2Z98_10685 [Spirochaetes bacterium GWB1_27_13]OHD20347.1 MAG: hypothetical protein A2Y34_10260 [Spirochaetes bacterium GWC1_27_15]OHD35569.1 MAG: hypothetical protein A2086_06025 [Spirochaetes bacterium GWD1_27_9]
MKIKYFVFILLSLFFQSTSMILAKYAALSLNEKEFLKILLNPYYILSFVCLGFQAITWQIALKHFNLSFAYMFMSLIYSIILFASHFLFNEPITTWNIIGTIIITSGVILVMIKGNKENA